MDGFVEAEQVATMTGQPLDSLPMWVLPILTVLMILALAVSRIGYPALDRLAYKVYNSY
jgi:hypothetical protein